MGEINSPNESLLRDSAHSVKEYRNRNRGKRKNS